MFLQRNNPSDGHISKVNRLDSGRERDADITSPLGADVSVQAEGSRPIMSQLEALTGKQVPK